MIRPWRIRDAWYATGVLEGIANATMTYRHADGEQWVEPTTSRFTIVGTDGEILKPQDVLGRNARYSSIRIDEREMSIPINERWPDGSDIAVRLLTTLPYLTGVSHIGRSEQGFEIQYANGFLDSADDRIEERIKTESHRVIRNLEQFMLNRASPIRRSRG